MVEVSHRHLLSMRSWSRCAVGFLDRSVGFVNHRFDQVSMADTQHHTHVRQAFNMHVRQAEANLLPWSLFSRSTSGHGSSYLHVVEEAIISSTMSKTYHHNAAVVVDTSGNVVRHHVYEKHVPENRLLKMLSKFYATTGRTWFDGVLYVEVHGVAYG